jgi:hypothetical protein
VELIGQGMEGAVYDLGDGTVRKVWFDRRPEDVLPLKAFLDELPELPFRTPRIREVGVGENGLAVSVEDKLTGVPLHEAGLPEEQALDAFVAVWRHCALCGLVRRAGRCRWLVRRSGGSPGVRVWRIWYGVVLRPRMFISSATCLISLDCWRQYSRA